MVFGEQLPLVKVADLSRFTTMLDDTIEMLNDHPISWTFLPFLNTLFRHRSPTAVTTFGGSHIHESLAFGAPAKNLGMEKPAALLFFTSYHLLFIHSYLCVFGILAYVEVALRLPFVVE